MSTATVIPAGLTLPPTETKLQNQLEISESQAFVKNENGKEKSSNKANKAITLFKLLQSEI